MITLHYFKVLSRQRMVLSRKPIWYTKSHNFVCISCYVIHALLKFSQVSPYPPCSEQFCNNYCCATAPCQHGGTCHEVCEAKKRRFCCTCAPGYTGHRCQLQVTQPPLPPLPVAQTQLRPCPAGMSRRLQIRRRMVFTRLWTMRTSSFQSSMTLGRCPWLHGLWSSLTPWKTTTRLNTKPSICSTCQSTRMLLTGKTTGCRCLVRSLSGVYRPTGEPLVIFRRIQSSTTAITFVRRLPSTTCSPFLDHIGALYEYVNIRGNTCENCTAYSPYSTEFTYHIDSWHHKLACDFNGHPNGTIFDEYNFGFYNTRNPSLRYSSKMASTTQYWFGSKWLKLIHRSVQYRFQVSVWSESAENYFQLTKITLYKRMMLKILIFTQPRPSLVLVTTITLAWPQLLQLSCGT